MHVATRRLRLALTPAQAGADGGLSRVGEDVVLRGWVRTVRAQKAFAFVEVRLRDAWTRLLAAPPPPRAPPHPPAGR